MLALITLANLSTKSESILSNFPTSLITSLLFKVLNVSPKATRFSPYLLLT